MCWHHARQSHKLDHPLLRGLAEVWPLRATHIPTSTFPEGDHDEKFWAWQILGLTALADQVGNLNLVLQAEKDPLQSCGRPRYISRWPKEDSCDFKQPGDKIVYL